MYICCHVCGFLVPGESDTLLVLVAELSCAICWLIHLVIMSVIQKNNLVACMQLIEQWDQLTLKDGVLYRQHEDANGHMKFQVILPEVSREEVLDSLHNKGGGGGGGGILGSSAGVLLLAESCRRCEAVV